MIKGWAYMAATDWRNAFVPLQFATPGYIAQEIAARLTQEAE